MLGEKDFFQLSGQTRRESNLAQTQTKRELGGSGQTGVDLESAENILLVLRFFGALAIYPSILFFFSLSRNLLECYLKKLISFPE